MYLSFEADSEIPCFAEPAKHPSIAEKRYVLYYTDQCPFNAKYVPIIEKTAKEYDVLFKAVHVSTKEQAQSLPTPCTTYVLFKDGEYVTNEILSEKKFLKMIGK